MPLPMQFSSPRGIWAQGTPLGALSVRPLAAHGACSVDSGAEHRYRLSVRTIRASVRVFPRLRLVRGARARVAPPLLLVEPAGLEPVNSVSRRFESPVERPRRAPPVLPIPCGDSRTPRCNRRQRRVALGDSMQDRRRESLAAAGPQATKRGRQTEPDLRREQQGRARFAARVGEPVESLFDHGQKELLVKRELEVHGRIGRRLLHRPSGSLTRGG